MKRNLCTFNFTLITKELFFYSAMVHIKICGITRLEDALMAEEMGASAVGFVFYRKSPRYIDPEEVREISIQLGPFISRVGVFVDEDPVQVGNIVRNARLTAIQLHGSEDPTYIQKVKRVSSLIIKAFRVNAQFECEQLKSYDVTAFLLDTHDRGICYGGTGKHLIGRRLFSAVLWEE